MKNKEKRKIGEKKSVKWQYHHKCMGSNLTPCTKQLRLVLFLKFRLKKPKKQKQMFRL